jgi:4-amino-4-deoxy-L-arabinose transferase-like glycosyltransferase
MEVSQDALLTRKEKIKAWFKDPYNLLLTGLFVFIIILYLYYFFKIGQQPIWWDEGDYLAIAKVWAQNMATPEWWGHFISMRPLVLPLIWTVFLKTGFGEIFLRFFTELAPAILSIFLIYSLGTHLFNKKIGLISAFLISINWVFMFYSFRLLTDIPSLFFSALALYFFWAKYEKPRIEKNEEKPIYLWLAVALGVLSFLTRYIGVLTLVVIAFYLFATRRFSLFKDKNIWIALFVGLLFLSPYFIYSYLTQGSFFPALSVYHGSQATAPHRPFAFDTLTFHLPNFLGLFTLLFFVLGFILLMEIFLYFDLILKQKEKTKNSLLFCFLSIVIPLVYFIFGIRAVDARYFIATAPLMFVVSALGVNFVAEKISNLSGKKLYPVIALIIIFIIAFQQLGAANQFIVSRIDSYKEIQEGGLWLKENTPKNAKIITASITQNQYYSERQSYDFYTNDTVWAGCTDMEGRLSQNETCQQETEEAFNRKIERIKPDYFVISVFEPVFTPQWAYAYPQMNNLTFVKAFGNYNGQPALIIFKFI